MTVRDLVDLLSDAYVVYELALRNVDMSRMTIKNRKDRLVAILEEEDAHPEHSLEYQSHLAADADLKFSRAFLDELRTLFVTDNVRNAAVVDVRLRFLITRVTRIRVVDNTVEYHQKQFLLNEFEQLLIELARIAIPLNINRSDTSTSSSSYQTPPTTFTPAVRYEQNFRSSAVWKWDLRFSGDDKQSASEFLQNARDYSHSRGISEVDLLRSISDLLTGSARKWLRTNTVPFLNWTDFANRFLRDFEPMYESDRLLDTIKKRLQKSDESIIQFFVEMENLFLRLSTVLVEAERIKIVRANLLPRYVTALAVYEFQTLWELKESCKRIEAADICLRTRPRFDSSVPTPGLKPQYPYRTNQATLPYTSGTQYRNPRQPWSATQNANYRQPQNLRAENTGQVIPYASNQTNLKINGNSQNNPIVNHQSVPTANIQQPGHPINCLEVFSTNANFPGAQAAVNQFYPNSGYPTHQLYPNNFWQSTDQYWSGSTYPVYQPSPVVNQHYVANPGLNMYIPSQMPLNEQVSSHVTGYNQSDNSPRMTCNQNTETHSQQGTMPNNVSNAAHNPNSSTSGNDRGTVGNGPPTVPNA